MRPFRALAAIVLGVLLAGCEKPIPQDRAAYVGAWAGADMRLLITAEGRVKYARGGTRISAPLQEFRGNDFVVGVGPLSTTFVVSVPPHAAGDTRKMTVDGVELTLQGASLPDSDDDD